MVEKYIGAVSGKIQTWQVEQQHNQQMAKEKREKERNDERRLGREPKATAELLANSKCPTDFDEHTELVGSLSVSLTNLGWQMIDMTGAVREWYKEGDLHKEKLRLLVDCSGCKDLVQVLIFPRNKLSRNFVERRKTRSVDRTTSTSSNKFKYDVKFNEDLAREDYVKNISSQSENLDPYRPFLVVHTEPVVMKRSRRRALDCSGAVRGQCCKQNFFVSFKELKWDDWIIAPKGYHANYCRGDCGGMHRTPDTFLNYHTHVIEEYRKMDRLSGIQPCCAPVKFSSMSLIYFGPDNNIIKRDLPKMVVEQCGCP
ncbi:hypothetical protein RUM44_000255 [Polyplax serrata]|uniref:TGF-beta family profile domain-containing protein n=1 Tax=Polyplax serrata TaxID=468196 RepID=A0ABR1B6D5_POLSC